jgi:hypothetical protein
MSLDANISMLIKIMLEIMEIQKKQNEFPGS